MTANEWTRVRNKIRLLLNLPQMAVLPRCPAKSGSIMKAFEEKGDHSHSSKFHICEACRCHKVAGSGTKGDFWGLGHEVGHYGVGWCSAHENGKFRKKHDGVKFARKHMELIRQQTAVKAGHEFAEIAKIEAQQAEEQIRARDGIELVKKTLDDFKNACDPNSMKPLREYKPSKDGPELVPASDITRIKTALEIAKVLSSILRDKVFIDSTSYLHIDDVKVRVFRTISIFQKYITDEKLREEFLDEYKNIWTDLKTVNKRT